MITSADPTTYTVHTVVKGDSLWAIARKYLGDGSRYKEIVPLNGLKSNGINIGQKLKIPK
jgi:LysM repeat protein